MLKYRRDAESDIKGRSIYGRVNRDTNFHVEPNLDIESNNREYFIDKQTMKRLTAEQIILPKRHAELKDGDHFFKSH